MKLDPKFSIIKKKFNIHVTLDSLIFICLLQYTLFASHSVHCKP